MSILTSADAAALLETQLDDEISIYSVGAPVTTGIHVTKPLTLLAEGIPALAQTTTLANAVESRVDSVYSVKVARGTDLEAGMVVEITKAVTEPNLQGKKLLLDKVNVGNISKAIAADWVVVNQEGKEGF
jgi:hypothetical protein